MNGYDMCKCASTECPYFYKCERGRWYREAKPGEVCTVSFLAEVCNRNNGFENFIAGDNEQ